MLELAGLKAMRAYNAWGDPKKYLHLNRMPQASKEGRVVEAAWSRSGARNDSVLRSWGLTIVEF